MALTTSPQFGAAARGSRRSRTGGTCAGIISSAPSTWKYFEISGWLLTACADLQRDRDRVHHEAVAFQLHLPPRHVEAGDELLVRAGRGMGEDRLVELALDMCVVDVLHQHHRALADRRHRLVRRVGLVDAQPHLARIGDQPRLHQTLSRRAWRRAPPAALHRRRPRRDRAATPRARRQRPWPCAAAGTATSARSRTTPRPTGR